MACTSTLTAITTSCASNIASIKKLIIGKFESQSWTPTYQEAENSTAEAPVYVLDADGNKIIESVVASNQLTSDKKWVEFSFRKNTGSMDSEMTVSDNGSHYFTNSVSLVFAKQDSAKRLALQAVASGDCSVIVLDGNNQYWLLGYDNEVSATTLTSTTGTAVGDNNSYNVTLSETSGVMAIPVSDGDTSWNKCLGVTE